MVEDLFCLAFGAHDNAYRLCCEKGQIENLRGMGDRVMLRYNEVRRRTEVHWLSEGPVIQENEQGLPS